ncbi:MAG TPA: hypothetical protein VEF89_28700 [Solirubrobacteraceae bacterium]|nr:hypothetical protein [Solirubrobacteraceae bacterium]
MYLDYLLADMVDQRTLTLDLTKLPQGLTGYYHQMWRLIQAEDEGNGHTWDHLHLPVLQHLAVAGEPVSAAWLADHLATPKREINRVLRRWQRFLQQRTPDSAESSAARWRIIHQSFGDFLRQTDEVELPAAHRAVADYYLANTDRWTAHDGYALRHLAGHLRAADDRGRLFNLVDDSRWRSV